MSFRTKLFIWENCSNNVQTNVNRLQPLEIPPWRSKNHSPLRNGHMYWCSPTWPPKAAKNLRFCSGASKNKQIFGRLWRPEENFSLVPPYPPQAKFSSPPWGVKNHSTTPGWWPLIAPLAETPRPRMSPLFSGIWHGRKFSAMWHLWFLAMWHLSPRQIFSAMWQQTVSLFLRFLFPDLFSACQQEASLLFIA